MTDRKFLIEHNGVEYTAKIATVKSTMLGYEDHGILTAYLHVEGSGWGVGVGGFALDSPGKEYSDPRKGTAYGLDHVMRLMETVGVSKWEDIKGKDVIVLFEGDGWGGMAKGIASLTDEKKIFILKEHAEAWRNAARD